MSQRVRVVLPWVQLNGQMANARAREVELGAPFKRYWAAAAISSCGASVTAVAMPVFVVQHAQASAFEVGLVNAAQLIPYAVLGLLAVPMSIGGGANPF